MPFFYRPGELKVPHPTMSPYNVAVITGGASGIGLAAAMRFARLGMKVCIADLDPNRLAEAETRISSVAPGGAADIMVATVDVSRIDDVSELETAVRERFGGADILMNKAGVKAFTEALQHELRNAAGSQIRAHLLIPGFVFTGLTAKGRTEKPAGAWTPEQTVDFMVERVEAGDFYILCPDNDVPRRLDERRILWAAGDIVENRPALSRWHPDYAAAFAAFVKEA